MITYEQIRNHPDVTTYIRRADETLTAIGITEHSFAHVAMVADRAGQLLSALGYDDRTAELARIAGYLHDIGNVINRADHAQSGALMAFRLLDKMGMDAEETSAVITAIGHHDEKPASPVSPIAAAIIIADKTDVRRTRVRNAVTTAFDIHDRVNYAVEESRTELDMEKHRLTLHLTIDTELCPVMEYFEIFLDRMTLCRKAAGRLGLSFSIITNGQKML